MHDVVPGPLSGSSFILWAVAHRHGGFIPWVRALGVVMGVIGAMMLGVVTASSAEAMLVRDGDSAPMILSVTLEAPQRHNTLLEVDLTVTGWAVGEIERYEYRWIGATVGAIHSTDAEDPVVSFASTIPKKRHILEVRALDDAGLRSRWSEVANMITPPPPRIIVAGDSIASGYVWGWLSADTSCRDDAFSYGATVQKEMAAALPPLWAPTYVNVAWAGAGVHTMWSGGTDGCNVVQPSQVEEIKAVADPATWNIVIVTAGINSTNWSDVVVGLTKNTTFSFTGAGDKKACQTALSETWNLPSQAGAITSEARRITETLTAETNADLYWTSYFTITGSRLVPGWTPIGVACDDEMATAMSLLDEALQEGLTDSVVWIDIDQGSIPLQTWGGWPHPNQEGQTMIGRTVASAIG